MERNERHVIVRNTIQFEPNRAWRLEYNDTWGCQLKSTQCLGRKSNDGRQCSRRTTYTLGYCWQHLKTLANLRIGQTELRDEDGNRMTFLGLFACKKEEYEDEVVFADGDNICAYIGEYITQKILDERYPGLTEIAPYVFRMSAQRYIDGACVRGVAALSNMCTDAKNCVNNAEIVKINPNNNTHFPVIRATAPIRNGDEILTYYGDMYFEDDSILYPVRTIYKKNNQTKYNQLKYKPC